MDIQSSPFVNSVFEQPWWLDIVAKGLWHEIIIKDNDKTIARLPYVFSKGKIKNPIYTQTLGIWLDESVKTKQPGNNQYTMQKEIFNQLFNQLPTDKKISIVLDSSIDYILPFRWMGFKIEPTISYRITNFERGLETIEKQWSKNIRRDVRQAGNKLEIDEDSNDFSTFIDLQNDTYKRQNRKNPIDNSLTKSIMQQAKNAGHGRLFLARDSTGIAHGGSFVIYDEHVCYHLLSGQNHSFGNDCVMPYLLSKEIQFSLTVSKMFDFEGSNIEGIETFFKRFGGQMIINWHISRQPLFDDIMYICKPWVKKILGYKI